jgi:hypothetical protein
MTSEDYLGRKGVNPFFSFGVWRENNEIDHNYVSNKLPTTAIDD